MVFGITTIVPNTGKSGIRDQGSGTGWRRGAARQRGGEGDEQQPRKAAGLAQRAGPSIAAAAGATAATMHKTDRRR